MPAKASTKSDTDTTSVAQGRFTVQLPAELKPMIVAIGDDVVKDFTVAKGMVIELSMAQVVGGIIKAQHDLLVARQSVATQDGAASTGDTGDGEGN